MRVVTFNQGWFEHNIVLKNITPKMLEKLKESVEKIYKSKVYNLFLMTDAIKKGGVPEDNAIYVQKFDKKLKYIVMSPNGNNTVIQGTLDIDIGEEALTEEKLESLRSKILEVTSKKGHTRSKEENDLTPDERDIVEMRIFAENVFIQQSPQESGLFDGHINQNDKLRASVFTSSSAQGDKIIHPVPLGIVIANKQELENYFSSITKQLLNHEITPNTERVCFLLQSENHAVGAYFDEESKKWHFMDVNYLSNKKNYYTEVDSRELADHLFTAFFDQKSKNTLFSITRLSMVEKKGEDKDPLNESIQAESKKLLDKAATRFWWDKTNSRGTNALTLAAMHGQEKAVIDLIANHASVNKKNDMGSTPLRLAIQNGYINIVKILFNAGAKEKLANKGDNTVLMLAAQQGHSDIVKLLLSRDEFKSKIDEKDEYGATALMIAASHNHTEGIEDLLHAGAKIDEQDEKGLTPLMYAVISGHFHAVETLLGSPNVKSQIEAQDNQGMTALGWAVSNGHAKVVEALLNNGAKVNNENKDKNILPTLIVAAGKGKVEVVKMLLENGALANVTNHIGMTPLVFAAVDGNISLVKFLFNYAPSVLQVKTTTQDTALTAAAKFGHDEVVAFLINKETDAEEQKKALVALCQKHELQTLSDLLEYVASNGHIEIVKTLLKMEIEIPAAALISAAASGHVDVVEALLKANKLKPIKDLNQKIRGDTRLMRWVRFGNIEIVKALISAGADLTVTNEKTNKNALALANDGGDRKIIELLEYALKKNTTLPESILENKPQVYTPAKPVIIKVAKHIPTHPALHKNKPNSMILSATKPEEPPVVKVAIEQTAATPEPESNSPKKSSS